MFGTWYVAMIFVCLSTLLYFKVWYREEGIYSTKKASFPSRMARWVLFFIPIVNTIFAFCFICILFMTIFAKNVILEAIKKTEGLKIKIREE